MLITDQAAVIITAQLMSLTINSDNILIIDHSKYIGQDTYDIRLKTYPNKEFYDSQFGVADLEDAR